MPGLFESVTGETTARLDLPDRGLLRVRGADRVRFLNGMISNDVETLKPGESCLATLLDRKGHVLADLYALRDADVVWLDVCPGRVDVVRELLDKYVIADDVEIEDCPSIRQRAIEGPGARDWLAAQGYGVPEAGRFELDDAGRTWLGGGALTPEGIRVFAQAESLDGVAAGLPEVSAEAAEILRIEAGIPRWGVDVTDRNFPLEARLDHALSRTKGCYVGQEIIARLISRGAVNKQLVRLETGRLALAGATVTSGGTRVGTVTSAAVSPVSGPIALAYVRTAELDSGANLEVDGDAARAIGPASAGDA